MNILSASHPTCNVEICFTSPFWRTNSSAELSWNRTVVCSQHNMRAASQSDACCVGAHLSILVIYLPQGISTITNRITLIGPFSIHLIPHSITFPASRQLASQERKGYATLAVNSSFKSIIVVTCISRLHDHSLAILSHDPINASGTRTACLPSISS
jgi:hypothetical protein